MFFRRNKADGFDWHKYVRTTIQLRRGQRRARLDAIGRDAAGRARAAGHIAADGLAHAAGASWQATSVAWRSTIAQPAVALPAVLIGGMALLSGCYRWFTVAADARALLPLSIGGVLLILVAPLALQRLFSGGMAQGAWPLTLPAGLSWSHPSGLATKIGAGVGAAAVLAMAGWIAWPHFAGTLTQRSPAGITAGAAGTLDGRAVALSGEMIRLQGRLLHLSGIEAPDRQQTCTRADKQSWRCGEAALSALDRLTRAKTFHCALGGGPDATGRTEATCTVDGQDVAAALVKDGHVFAVAAMFGGYSDLERAARRAGSGVWAGAADRPAEYRAKLWAVAKANAPDNCPIKGLVNGGRKTYLMPWSPRYDTANVRTSRGERWLCDEAQAQAAGFKVETRRRVAGR